MTPSTDYQMKNKIKIKIRNKTSTQKPDLPLFDFGLRPFGGEQSLEEELGPGGQCDKTTRSRFSMGEDLGRKSQRWC